MIKHVHKPTMTCPYIRSGDLIDACQNFTHHSPEIFFGIQFEALLGSFSSRGKEDSSNTLSGLQKFCSRIYFYKHQPFLQIRMLYEKLLSTVGDIHNANVGDQPSEAAYEHMSISSYYIIRYHSYIRKCWWMMSNLPYFYLFLFPLCNLLHYLSLMRKFNFIKTHTFLSIGETKIPLLPVMGGIWFLFIFSIDLIGSVSNPTGAMCTAFNCVC